MSKRKNFDGIVEESFLEGYRSEPAPPPKPVEPMTDAEKIKFRAALSEMLDNLAEQAKDEGFYGGEFLHHYNRLCGFVQGMKRDIRKTK